MSCSLHFPHMTHKETRVERDQVTHHLSGWIWGKAQVSRIQIPSSTGPGDLTAPLPQSHFAHPKPKRCCLAGPAPSAVHRPGPAEAVQWWSARAGWWLWSWWSAGLAAVPGPGRQWAAEPAWSSTGRARQESQIDAPPPVGQKEGQVRGKEPAQQLPQWISTLPPNGLCAVACWTLSSPHLKPRESGIRRDQLC